MSQEITFELMQRQMNFLEKYLNAEARCVYWNLGKLEEVSGTLRLIVPFDRIIKIGRASWRERVCTDV